MWNFIHCMFCRSLHVFLWFQAKWKCKKYVKKVIVIAWLFNVQLSACPSKMQKSMQPQIVKHPAIFYDTTKRGGVDNQSEEFSLSGNDKQRKIKG